MPLTLTVCSPTDTNKSITITARTTAAALPQVARALFHCGYTDELHLYDLNKVISKSPLCARQKVLQTYIKDVVRTRVADA